MQKELRVYRTKQGGEPFTHWLETLKDKIARAKITNRLNRVMLGNYGDYKFVGDGIYELKIHYGPGYRVYFTVQQQTIVLLLIGGSKRTQYKDIEQAKKFWREFKERNYE